MSSVCSADCPSIILFETTDVTDPFTVGYGFEAHRGLRWSYANNADAASWLSKEYMDSGAVEPHCALGWLIRKAGICFTVSDEKCPLRPTILQHGFAVRAEEILHIFFSLDVSEYASTR